MQLSAHCRKQKQRVFFTAENRNRTKKNIKPISKLTYKDKNPATSINKTQRLNPQYQDPN
jgi:hypothetical protein